MPTSSLGDAIDELVKSVFTGPPATVGARLLDGLPPAFALGLLDVSWFRGLVEEVVENLAEPEGDALYGAITAPPVGFPKNIPHYYTASESFDGANRPASAVNEPRRALPLVHRAVPSDAADLIRLADWARAYGVRVRPVGSLHSWSPTLAMDGKEVALDLRRFRDLVIDPAARTATIGVGVTLEEASRALVPYELMLPVAAAVGGATLGGLAALGAHGCGTLAGLATMSACVLEIHAIVASGATHQQRVFKPGDPEFAALQLHLGASIVTKLKFALVPATEFTRTIDSKKSSRYLATPLLFDSVEKDLKNDVALELLWFPDQGDDADEQQLLRRAWTAESLGGSDVETDPYTDAMVNWAVRDVDAAFRRALVVHKADVGENLQRILGLSAIGGGERMNAHATRLYSTQFILRFRAAGWCLVATRQAVPELLRRLSDELHALQRSSQQVATGPVEVRISGVDPIDGPLLSPARWADPGAVAVWLNLLADRDRAAGKLMRQVEAMLLGLLAQPPDLVLAVRPEWSKAWAFDANGDPWKDTTTRARLLSSLPINDARIQLDLLDPAPRAFRSPLADWVL